MQCAVCVYPRIAIDEVALCLQPVPVNTTPCACVATSESSCHPVPLPCYFSPPAVPSSYRVAVAISFLVDSE
jgi:hypothetical protein